MTEQPRKGRNHDERQRVLSLELAKRLKEARLSMAPSLSQEALGKALGVSFQMFQKYERGECHMTPAQVIVAAETLKLPVSFLLLGFDDSNKPAKFPLTPSDLKRGLLEWQKTVEKTADRRTAKIAKHVIETWLVLAQ